MRRLLLLALMGMALSKLYFGSFVPPELRFKAPRFNILKDGADAPKPRWFTNPEHLHPAWMHAQRSAPKPNWLARPARLHPAWMQSHR
jgi:hypothetical protein